MSRRNWMLGIALATAIGASARTAYAGGACCKSDGTCSDVANSAACSALGAGAFYLGDGTACATSNCTRGGCVINPLNSDNCVFVSQAECLLQEGQWLGAGVTCASVQINNVYVHGGQVNISGATLFNNFFTSPASTNDYLGIDGDHIWCRSPLPDGPVTDTGLPYVGFVDSDCAGGLDGIDQLAPGFCSAGGTFWGEWLVQYRGVGSVEGLIEFIDNQLMGTFDTSIPSTLGLINRTQWASGGVVSSTCRPAADCNPGSGTTNDSGTPICPNSIDLAVGDVPSSYATVGTGSSSDAKWDKKPTTAGYGRNAKGTYPNSGLNVGQQLASLDRGAFGSLNLNTASPDANTLYDSPVAWVPIAFMANRGTGLKDVRYTQLQHLYVTGRMPNGENLIAATRDAGSGTRNAAMNSLGIDSSWGRGDNFGPRINITSDANLGLSIATHAAPLADIRGKRTQSTNCGGSGQIRQATQMFRLAVGYTGLAGSGSASTDAASGNYEILNLCKDVDSNGVEIAGYTCPAQACDGGPNPSAGGAIPRAPGCPTPAANMTQANNGYVRPNLFTVLDNANGLCGYQIGGLESFISRGDPLAGVGAGPFLPATANPAMSNLAARDYIRNIRASVAGFSPASVADTNTPGQFLANTFFLAAGVDGQPVLNPTDFPATPGFVQSLQDYMRCNNTLDVKDFGSINVAGKVPTRNSLAGTTNPPFLFTAYSDGSVNGSYDNGTGALTLGAGGALNHRNQVAGDFNYDLARNVRDIPELMKALKNPRKYENDEYNFSATGVPLVGSPPPTPNPLGGMGRNFIVPEISGDFNGDGNFDAQDIRYFADGLAIDPNTGKLNRCLGWEMVDAWWLYYKVGPGTSFPNPGVVRPEYAGPKPPWAPTLPAYLPAWPDARVLGAAMADIAGNPTAPGWEPTGYDGRVDGRDIDYVYANFGNFAALRYDAANIDLSADMNGDLVVNQADVDKIVRDILCTHYGDRNLDGVVNAADDPTPNLGLTPAGWADGDFDGDKIVTASDVAIFNANLGATSSCRVHCLSDVNCDGKRDGTDVSAFVLAVTNPALYDVTFAKCGCFRHNADATADGVVDALDIPGFVNDLLATSPCPAN